MRVATIDGLVTLFYDGSKEVWNEELDDEWDDEFFRLGYPNDPYDNWEAKYPNLSPECKRRTRERMTWQQVIIAEGITEIPRYTFARCIHVKRVIFADSVVRIHFGAFYECASLVFIKLPVNLESIGESVFVKCDLLSVFVPPRCREIGNEAFSYNRNLEILSIPKDIQLGQYQVIFRYTKLLGKSPFGEYLMRWFPREFRIPQVDASVAARCQEIHSWLENINDDEEYDLHRVCASFQPSLQMIVDTMKERGGPKAFKVKNRMGITPSRYLKENPYAEVTEKEIIDKYTLQMMGEYENM